MSEQRVQEMRRGVESVRQLESTSPDELNRYMLGCLSALLEHAAATTPHYREALANAGWRTGQPLTPGVWRQIPALDRDLLQHQPDRFLSNRLPDACGPTRWVHSSGSTGNPIRVRGTAQQATLWNAITLSEHLEHERDFMGRMAVIRVMNGPHGHPPAGSDLPDWGEPVSALYRTGSASVLSIDADSRTQAHWLASRDPHYLLTYPSNLWAVMDALQDQGLSLPSLRQVRTISEALGEDTRLRCREQLGVDVADAYSAVEVGYIATQVRGGDHYRCRNETLLVEVLGNDGLPAPVGIPGQVVVTALYSYAMPLIRYALDDVAVARDRSLWCDSPRHLDHIVGRRRNLIKLPDGSQRWPRLGLRRMNAIVPLRRVQLVQTRIDAMLLRVVCHRPLTAAEGKQLERHVTGRFESVSDVTLEQVAEIPRGPGGKFEEFVCMV